MCEANRVSTNFYFCKPTPYPFFPFPFQRGRCQLWHWISVIVLLFSPTSSLIYIHLLTRGIIYTSVLEVSVSTLLYPCVRCSLWFYSVSSHHILQHATAAGAPCQALIRELPLLPCDVHYPPVPNHPTLSRSSNCSWIHITCRPSCPWMVHFLPATITHLQTSSWPPGHPASASIAGWSTALTNRAPIMTEVGPTRIREVIRVRNTTMQSCSVCTVKTSFLVTSVGHRLYPVSTFRTWSVPLLLLSEKWASRGLSSVCSL